MLLSESDSRYIYGLYIRGVNGYVGNRCRVTSPFRTESNPSFEINLSNGLWYDYGSGEGGDIIDFICRVDSVDYGIAKERLDGIMNREVSVTVIKDSKVKKENAGGVLDIIRREWLDKMYKWNADIFIGRGIDEGVFKANGGYMWKEGAVVKVLIDYSLGSSGDMVTRYKMFVYKNNKKYVYTRGSVTLYPYSSLRCKDVVLCEGEYDALSLLSKGYNAITGTGGAGTFKEEWIWALSKKNIYVIYDNDEPGIKGSSDVAASLRGWCKKVNIHKWDNNLPLHYDVGDYITNGGSFDGIIKFR